MRSLAYLGVLVLVSVLVTGGTGCSAPGVRLTFPQRPVETDSKQRSYDVNADGMIDFAMIADEQGRFDVIVYDDDEDGEFNRTYRLSEYADTEVPHLILLLDSIPFEPTRQRFEQDRWSFFEAPTKVIAPFPSMSGVIFSVIMGVAPMDGANNRYFDTRTGRQRDAIWARIWGYTNPWQRDLDYHASYIHNGLAFLHPRPWFAAELALAKKAFDTSGKRETIVYIASTSGMMSKYGAQGLKEIFDGVERLSLQLLYERNGAVKISILSDHGHNLIAPERIDLEPTLREAGFTPSSSIRTDEDVVIDLDGLVNYAGLHTRRPREVAEVLAGLDAVEVAMFVEGERVVVLTAAGEGYVERHGGRLRFVSTAGNPLDYQRVVDELRRSGHLDENGFASPEEWFKATVDHEWPNVPPRVWDAFHGVVVSTPDVMLSMRDGWCVGDKRFERYIDMLSTHGGLNQVNSAAVLLTMRREVAPALRSRDALPALRANDAPLP